MAKKEDVKKAVAKTENLSIEKLIEKSAKELGKALPAHMRPERITRIALTTLRMNKKLYSCDPYSFLGALFQSAQLGLEPNVEGQAYIIPYANKAQFQIGYKGYVELFYRHLKAISIDMQSVYENDTFEYQYGTEAKLVHVPALKDRGKVVAYYAVAKMKDGANAFKVMSREDCEKHGKQHSKTFKNGPWQTDFDAMAKKTVLIQLMKLLPKSIEIQKALAMDETVKSNVMADMFDVPDETDWEEATETEAEVEEPEDNRERIHKKAEDAGLYDEGEE